MPTPEELAAIEAQLIATAGQARTITVDGMTVQNASAAETIKTLEYLRKRQNAARRTIGRQIKFVPPGTC